MKKIFIFPFLIWSSFTYSCEAIDASIEVYPIRNDSGFELDLQSYLISAPKYLENFNVDGAMIKNSELDFSILGFENETSFPDKKLFMIKAKKELIRKSRVLIFYIHKTDKNCIRTQDVKFDI